MSCSHAEAHSHGIDAPGLVDLINTTEYADIEQFYYLSQQKLFEILFEKYGVEGEKKNVTTDDKIRLACILFCQSELRDYIPDMSGLIWMQPQNVSWLASVP